MNPSCLARLRATGLTGPLRTLMIALLVLSGSVTLAGAVCGDGVIDDPAMEECDGTDLGGATCASLGYSGGTLACGPTCTFDTSGCNPAVCGNGAVEPGEQCDGTNLGGQTCVSLGYTGGTLACGAACQFDTSACTICPDADGDGYLSDACGGNDCNDSNPSIYPGAPEVCNGIDEDCDTIVDDAIGGAPCDGVDGDFCQEGTLSCTGGALECSDGTGTNIETCNNFDDDCDGFVDEGNPGGGAACSTGLPGVCAAGTMTCQGGALQCVSNTAPRPEICNGLDDDCDGAVDDACTLCGNGTVDAGEECDDGNTNDYDACLTSCVAARCGDGLVHLGVEQCDDGNTSNEDDCLSDCSVARCGDGFVNLLSEECDDGNFDNNDNCLINCTAARCGDGFLNFGAEECDDGNFDNNDNCLINCTAARCGDGFLNFGAEECDDGNNVSGDGCTSFCTFEECASDGQCDNFFACDGIERCDPMTFRCVPGTPVNCSDGDPCTFDNCDPETGACTNIPSGDAETARGPDGLCNTLDDNLALFGADRMCGTGDDGVGDGVCGAIDNCPQAWNPTQSDADGDRAGDACDPASCRSRSAYVTDLDRLLRVDLATGSQQPIGFVGGQLNGVDVNADETRAFLAQDSGLVLGIELGTGMVSDVGVGLALPWGVALAPGEILLYVTDAAAGEVVEFNTQSGGGSGFPVASGLNQPLGIAVAASGDRGYVAEYGSGELSEVGLGAMAGPVIVRASGLTGPAGVALDAAGTIAYVTEADSGELSRIELATGMVTLVAGGLAFPVDVVLDPSGTTAYVMDLGNGQLTAVDLGTGGLSPIAAGLDNPLGLDLGNAGPNVMSLPEAMTGSPGAGIVVPVALSDVSGQGVLSADFTVEFNPAVLTATGATPGALAAGCTVTANLSVPGRAVVSLFCTSDRSGSGTLVDLAFTVVGAEGAGSPLHFSQGMLNEGTPAVCLEDGSFVVPVRISGRISYYRDDVTSIEPSTKSVPGALTDLIDLSPPLPGGIPGGVTGCAGDYGYASLLPGHLYRLTPTKANDFGAAIDPYDASLNAQHVVGLISLTPNQRLAADVTGNGTLSSLDSARIAQFSVGLISQFPVASVYGGDWAFVPIPQAEPNALIQYPVPSAGLQGAIYYSPLVESAENQDFLGVLFGDVSGNWQPPACSPASGFVQPLEEAAAAAAATAVSRGGTLSFPTLTAKRGDIIRVPVTGTGVAEAVSFYLDVRYNAKVLRLVEAQPGAATAGFSTTANTQEAGRGRLALFRATPIGTDGEVAVLTFEVIGRPGSRSWLRLPSYTVNEGKIAVSVDEGLVTVERRARGRR